MGTADLHIHSIYSYDGTASIPAILKHVAENTDLDMIAITDHDSTEGVHEALDLAAAYGLQVIPGCEISSKDGHVLALYVDRPVKPGLSLLETVLRVGALGGLCIAAHPTAPGMTSLDFDTIQTVLRDSDAARVLVGVEAFNGGLVYTRRNPRVAAQARALPLAQLGNSDAHVLRTIGQGATLFNGSSPADLRRALETATTQVREGAGLTGAAVLGSYIPHYLLRMLGWVEWNASPQGPMTYARIQQVYPNQNSLQTAAAWFSN